MPSLVGGVTAGDRATLARAMTLIESSSPRHAASADLLLTRLLPRTGGSVRVGITGVPGAGKSTFIEELGTRLTAQGKRVAVLAVDPSSSVTGGSVLGDKTRMARLAADERAFVRPSPSSGELGGVARKTREAVLLCEAAGYDVVFVETVGVGQSETVVAGMTDIFVALLIAGAGDELQGIKRGLLELVDVVAINKAEGENRVSAERAATTHRTAFHLVSRGEGERAPVVHTCSAMTGDGIAEIWQGIEDRAAAMRSSGALAERRSTQAVAWMRALLDDRIRSLLDSAPGVAQERAELEGAVRRGEMPATVAVERLIGRMGVALDRGSGA